MPVTLKEIRAELEPLAPLGLAAGWDNVGLLVGDERVKLNKVLLALEVDKAVAQEAKNLGCNLIITHHPLIFKPLKKVLAGNYVSDVLTLLIKNDIACYAMHTNLDKAPRGVNYVLAKTLGLSKIEPLAEADSNNPGCIGELGKAYTWRELVALVKAVLSVEHLKTVPQNTSFHKIAVCGGAGMEFWSIAQNLGADCLISADSSYHEGIEAKHRGMALIDAGHYHTENLIVKEVAAYLRTKLPDLEVILSKVKTDPWQIF